MSRAYRIKVKESISRQVKGSDEISTTLEVLEILPPEAMAELLRKGLADRGYTEQEDGTFIRNEGSTTITVDPCSGEVTVKSDVSQDVELQAEGEASAWDDVGPSEAATRARVSANLQQQLEKQAEKEGERLQSEATTELEKKLEELQPELGKLVNEVTRQALKEKAKQMGTIKEISEDAESGNLTIKVEV